MSLSVAQLREHVETDLPEDALDRLLASELEAIELHAGPADEATEYMDALGHRDLRLRRDAESITTVETRSHPDDDEVTLAADDFRLEKPRTLVRLSTGSNPAAGWLGRVRVVYVPEVDTALRDRVLVDLVKLALEFRGLEAESAGDTSQTHTEYTAERQRLLSQLSGRRSILG